MHPGKFLPPLLLFGLLLQACSTTAAQRNALTDCDRAGGRTLQRLAAVPEQADLMRRIADENPVSARPVPSQIKYERWYVIDDANIRLCRDEQQLGAEIWEFAKSGDEVTLVDMTLLLSLD